MRVALVVAFHPNRTCDLVFQDTGLRIAGAHILSSMVSNDGGVWDVPSVPKPTSERLAGELPATGRQLVAAVDMCAGRWCVVGWLHPLGGQLAFTQPDRHVERHSSGAYSTVAPDGSIEVWHPSGTFLRLGTGAAHEPLAPISHDKAWKEVSNAPQPTIHLHTAKVDLTIDPQGNVTLHTAGNGSLAFDGTLAVASKGAMTIHSDVSVSVTAPQINLN
jgi:hypothetical protein